MTEYSHVFYLKMILLIKRDILILDTILKYKNLKSRA